MRRLLLLLTAVTILSACSSSVSNPGSGGADSQGSTSPSKTSASSSVLAPAAAIRKFEAHGLPVSKTYTFTAANDPNHLLGRPNGYIAKIAWTDKRVKPNSDPTIDTTKGSVDLGGSIEQFRSASAAKARAAYIRKVEKAEPVLGSEYDFVVDDSLIRVSRILTPKQAHAYRSAVRG